MQKDGKILDDKISFWENTRKTRENMQKHGKTLGDKVLFQQNTEKHQENTHKKKCSEIQVK